VEEAMEKSPGETWTPNSLKFVREVLLEELEIEKREDKDLSRSRTLEVEVKCKDGSTAWTEAKVSFLRDQSGNPIGIIGVTRDISERRKAEEALQQSEERYRSLVENTIYGFFIHEIPSGRFLFFNQRACELFGYTVKEGLELTVWDVLSPEDHEHIKERVQARTEGKKLGPDIQTYTALRKDTSAFRLEVSSSLITFQGKPAVQGVFRDVTEQERFEEQLKRAQKMEAIGTLAGGIAHDFNNLLMGIQGRTSLLLTSTDSSHSYFKHLKGIEEYVKSATELTRQLLGLARGGKYEVKPIGLNELIKNQNKMFGRTRKEINIQERFEENLWTVEVDQGQIEQVLLNIYVNAWHAMSGGGELYIHTENIVIDEEYGKSYLVEPGNYVKISITDTGIGMDEETQKKIFDPFFTTKEVGRGTGLGLASAYGIIKNHNGFINVYSEKGEGATFEIYLPASEKEAVKIKEIDGELLTGTETVLLVDDEDLIIDVGHEMVENLGYEALVAKSGKEAIEKYQNNRDKIDMVILDMIMPDMGGGEVYDRLKEINPSIKVLLSSGYSINGQATEILERGCNGFIQKPFNMADLSRKIREVLDQDQ
jgi:PAS domain S-box-containing protein